MIRVLAVLFVFALVNTAHASDAEAARARAIAERQKAEAAERAKSEALAAEASNAAAAANLDATTNMTGALANITNATNASNMTNATNATEIPMPRQLTDEEKEEAEALRQQEAANERSEKRKRAKEAEQKARERTEAAIKRAAETRKRAREKAAEARAKKKEARRKMTEEVHKRKADAQKRRVDPRDTVDVGSGKRHAFQMHWHEKEALLPLLHEAHGKIARPSETKGGRAELRAADLIAFVRTTLNPDTHDDVHHTESKLIASEVRALREQEGLLDDNMVVPHGYLTRGHPLRFLQRITRRLAEHRQRRQRDEEL